MGAAAVSTQPTTHAHSDVVINPAAVDLSAVMRSASCHALLVACVGASGASERALTAACTSKSSALAAPECKAWVAFFDGTNGAALEPNTSGSAHSKQFVRRGPVQALVGLIAVTSAPIPAGEPVVASTPPDESVAPRLTQCRMTSCQAGTEMGVYVLCSSNFSSITQMSFDNNALKGQQQRP